MIKNLATISDQSIEKKIIVLRGSRVMLSTDLARLYEVEHRILVQAVKRNIERFPTDFMFQITKEELAALKSQGLSITTISLPSPKSPDGISQRGRHTKYSPYAFTEQGVAMLSSVLRSKRAIRVNIEIIRTFVTMKRMMISYNDIETKINDMEKKYDIQFSAVFDAIRQLMAPPKPKKKQIGFHWTEEPASKKKKVPTKKTPPKKTVPPRKAPAKKNK